SSHMIPAPKAVVRVATRPPSARSALAAPSVGSISARSSCPRQNPAPLCRPSATSSQLVTRLNLCGNPAASWLRISSCRQTPARSAGYFHAANYCLQRSEEHTSELQSRFDLVCRLLLE